MSALAQIRSERDQPADSPSEQQLRESQKMESIGRLVGGVAHDFNNLLTGMVLCSELLLVGLEKDSRLRHYAEEIRSAGVQGAALIQQLLAVARQRVVAPRLLSLNEVIAGMRSLLARLIGENIELMSELADDLGLVKMDPAQVQQIILNLVLNARDAMPEGGRIALITRNCSEWRGKSDAPRVCGSWIEFAVSDTGCGMDSETRSRLFEPFFTTKKPGQGNGLGLTTVHSIVKHEGGSVQVESEPGKGTRVVVYLPRAEPESESGDVKPSAQSGPLTRKVPNRRRGGKQI